MRARRHGMRKQQRRDSARDWIRSAASVTVRAYASRYGVDFYTAYDDLTALGSPLPAAAQQWAPRPPATPRRAAKSLAENVDDEWWSIMDGRKFFVAGYTAGGAPYGMFDDEMEP